MRDLLARRSQLERRIAAAEAALPDRFPPGGAGGPGELREEASSEWNRTESARADPLDAAASQSPQKPRCRICSVLPDDSVLASGDESKSDRYQVDFDNVPSEITALAARGAARRVAAQTRSGTHLLRRSVRRFPVERIHRDGRRSAGPLPGGGPVVRVQSRRSGGGDRRQPAHLLDGQRRPGKSARGRLHSGQAAAQREAALRGHAVRVLLRGRTGTFSDFGGNEPRRRRSPGPAAGDRRSADHPANRRNAANSGDSWSATSPRSCPSWKRHAKTFKLCARPSRSCRRAW